MAGRCDAYCESLVDIAAKIPAQETQFADLLRRVSDGMLKYKDDVAKHLDSIHGGYQSKIKFME